MDYIIMLNEWDLVKFKVLTATRVKMTVYWDVAPCSVVDINRRFIGYYCLHDQGDE
jgi:hypothetical protein